MTFCIGLSIGFEDAAYTVREDSGTVEVCLMFEGPLKNSSFVELQISLTSASASGTSTTFVVMFFIILGRCFFIQMMISQICHFLALCP